MEASVCFIGRSRRDIRSTRRERAWVADFRLALLRPSVGRFRQHVGDGFGDAHGNATEDLPLSRNCRRGVVRWTNTITGSSGPAY